MPRRSRKRAAKSSSSGQTRARSVPAGLASSYKTPRCRAAIGPVLAGPPDPQVFEFEQARTTIACMPREERAVRNEDLFREVNVHIAGLEGGSRSLSQDGLLPLVCECARPGCSAPIEVDAATFERVRESPLRFLVAAGHEDLDIESVIEERQGYLIVEKHNP
jgi:hypothetical protein